MVQREGSVKKSRAAMAEDEEQTRRKKRGRREGSCRRGDSFSASRLSPSLSLSLLSSPLFNNTPQSPLFANARTAGPSVASTAPFQVAAASEASVGGSKGSGSCFVLLS